MCEQAEQATPPLRLSDNPPLPVASELVAPLSGNLDPYISKNPRPIVEGDLVHASVQIAAGESTTERLHERLRFNIARPPEPKRLSILDVGTGGYRTLCGLRIDDDPAIDSRDDAPSRALVDIRDEVEQASVVRR